MDSLDKLKEDAWAFWRTQLDGLPAVNQAAGAGQRTIYANVALFDLKNYTPNKFPAGGRFTSEPTPGSGSSKWMYRLDAQGRPLHMSGRHEHNKYEWQGISR